MVGTNTNKLGGVFMDRWALKDIFSVAVASRDKESNEAESLGDFVDNQTLCTGESCAFNWKPTPYNKDRGDEIE